MFRGIKPAEKRTKCRGLFFRFVKDAWIGSDKDINVRYRFRFLKSKSCDGCGNCECLWDQVNEACCDAFDYNTVDGIEQNNKNRENRIFQLKVIGVSTDWETGYIDDIDIGMVEVIQQEKPDAG